MLTIANSHGILTVNRDFYPKIRRRLGEKFRRRLGTQRLDLTWSGQADFTAATLRSTSHSARNLGFIFNEHLTFSDQITALTKPVAITFVNFAVSGYTLIRQLPVLLLPLSFTPNSITVILCTIKSLSLNYPVSSWSRTLLLVLSWKRPNPVIWLPSF